MKIDFHSHILPGIDDGSKNIEESVALLDIMAADGVDIVVATPHFYCTHRSIHSFLERRNNAYKKLKPYLKPEHPRILLGGEVLYDDILIGKDDLSRLTIQGTNFMLLEMPYTKLTEKHL
ncbi:MAG: histidinol-phosphatase, partial [Ruminococcus sp.]|nr:histidinol-phosphatase [Ruminococcus sp.]